VGVEVEEERGAEEVEGGEFFFVLLTAITFLFFFSLFSLSEASFYSVFSVRLCSLSSFCL